MYILYIVILYGPQRFKVQGLGFRALLSETMKASLEDEHCSQMAHLTSAALTAGWELQVVKLGI